MRVLHGTYSAGLSNWNRRTTRGDYPEINCSIVHARERCSTSAQFYREGLYAPRDVHYRANVNMALDKLAQTRQETRFPFIFVNFHLPINRCERRGNVLERGGNELSFLEIPISFFSFMTIHSFVFRVIYLFLNLSLFD